jgi:hypothetical protein
MNDVRSCDGCTKCCEVLPFYEVNRDWDDGCKHCESGVGCTVYRDRAKLVHEVCETYSCAWKAGLGAPEDRPDKSGFIVDSRKSVHGHGLHAVQVLPEANREALNRMCDDAQKPIFHTTRRMKLVETWRS